MVTKLTLPSKENAVQEKVNEIIDNLGGGSTYTAGTGIDITNNVISVDGETVSEVELATVATSGSYNDLSNKPTIPTVNNATLTITQGGTTKGTFTANASSNVTIDLDSGGGASRNIGEIVQSTIPLTDAGLHLLDGALISGSGSYADFVTYIAGLVSTYPDLFTTESNWQSAVSTYGVCGKFVYDSVNNTVRLPKITGFTEGTTDLTALGDLIQAGLPNITGEATFDIGGIYGSSTPTGAFYKTTSFSGLYGTARSTVYSLGMDASRSNSVYGNSTTVQPQSIKVLYYIVIATSTKTSIEVDIDEIATDLNGKADVDLSNCTRPHIIETYSNGASWYRVWSDGWCEQGGKPTGTSSSSVSVNLIKPYKDTNYIVLNGFANTSGTSARDDPIVINNMTENGFSMVIQTSATMYIMWKTCGYIN